MENFTFNAIAPRIGQLLKGCRILRGIPDWGSRPVCGFEPRGRARLFIIPAGPTPPGSLSHCSFLQDKKSQSRTGRYCGQVFRRHVKPVPSLRMLTILAVIAATADFRLPRLMAGGCAQLESGRKGRYAG